MAHTAVAVLDEIEKETGVRPDLKAAMRKLLTTVIEAIDSGWEGTDVDGIELYLFNYENKGHAIFRAGLVPRFEDPADEDGFAEGVRVIN